MVGEECLLTDPPPLLLMAKKVSHALQWRTCCFFHFTGTMFTRQTKGNVFIKHQQPQSWLKTKSEKTPIFFREQLQGFSESLKEQLRNMFSQFHLFPEILPTVLPIQSEMKDSSNLGGLIFDLSHDPLPTTSSAWGVPDTPVPFPAEKLPASRITNQPNPVGRSL